MNRSLFFFLLLISAGAFLAVQFSPPAPRSPSQNNSLPGWTLADVRMFDPADAAAPTHDLLAVYLRPSGADLDLRLDFLDSATLPDYDLAITLDLPPYAPPAAQSGQPQEEPDATALIPAHGPLRLLDANRQPIPGAGMRVLRNPALDQITVNINGLPGGKSSARVQVFVQFAGSTALADQSAPTAAGPGALRPARLGLVFTNAFPAYSPATALRRWRGAHTGPLGGSHGLALLLKAAKQGGVPLALTDGLRSEALPALDAVGALPQLTEMQQQGLLALHPASSQGAQGMETLRRFGLEPAAQPQRRSANRPAAQLLEDPLQVVEDGLTLELRRALIAAALAENTPTPAGSDLPVVLLGGELPNSAWGAANHAETALHYLAARPWVRFLTAAELAEYLPQPQDPDPRFAPAISAQEQTVLLAALRAAPGNALGLAAQQAYSALYAPVYPAADNLPALRAGYRGVVWSLIYAAAWADTPQARADCASDPDHDGQAECLLADARYYAQFEAESGALTYFFSRNEHGAHQWVGPSAQFIVGMSDPAHWDLSRGLLADPTVIPGAFFETPSTADGGAMTALTDGRLTFEGGAIQKVFTLSEDGLHAIYHAGGPLPGTILLGLAPDPWQRFKPGWAQGYTSSRSSDGASLSIQAAGSSAALWVRSACPLTVQSFRDSAAWMDRAENPDREYPPGHYLPFPMFLIECTPGAQTTVNIVIGE